MEQQFKACIDEAIQESFRRSGKAAALDTSAVWNIVSGLRTRFSWLDILKYLPEIVSLVQTMGPKIQEIIAIISSFLERLNPAPTPPSPFPAP